MSHKYINHSEDEKEQGCFDYKAIPRCCKQKTAKVFANIWNGRGCEVVKNDSTSFEML